MLAIHRGFQGVDQQTNSVTYSGDTSRNDLEDSQVSTGSPSIGKYSKIDQLIGNSNEGRELK
jgi:hypothetical protein